MELPVTGERPKGAGVAVDFDLGIYRLTALKKAAYKFGDRFHIQINTQANRAIVTLDPRASPMDLQHCIGEFRNEVLDQELREVVAQETEGIRNLLLAQAFSSVSLIDEKGDEGDYHADPVGISNASKKTPPAD